jgi:mevalonate kinase
MIKEYGVTHPKLLIFGEYGILLGGSALTLPLNTFSARLDFLDHALDFEIARKSNKKLKEFADYLGKSAFMSEKIDVEGLVMDILDGLYLLSDIPIGYGLGSSGVLCAAIYKAYGRDHKPVYDLPDHLLVFKNLFSSMEAFFHGKSSGLDPLACLVGKPLLIRNNTISVLHSVDDLKGDWFLIDSGLSRDTGSLVDVFLSKCYNSQFKNDFQLNYLSFVNSVIEQVQSEKKDREKHGKSVTMGYYMEAISLAQLNYFNEMIPAFLIPFWQQGLDTGCFFLKLLGAGGGGYFLGLSQQKTTTEEMAAAYGFKLQWLDL